MRTSYPGLKTDGDNSGRDVARIVNNILRGAMNVVVEFDVPGGVAAVDVVDARIRELSVPLTGVGTSITAYAYVAEGSATVGVTPGPARVERMVILG
jgi:hypothetical protein